MTVEIAREVIVKEEVNLPVDLPTDNAKIAAFKIFDKHGRGDLVGKVLEKDVEEFIVRIPSLLPSRA